jgi:hypothetical protein
MKPETVYQTLKKYADEVGFTISKPICHTTYSSVFLYREHSPAIEVQLWDFPHGREYEVISSDHIRFKCKKICDVIENLKQILVI